MAKKKKKGKRQVARKPRKPKEKEKRGNAKRRAEQIYARRERYRKNYYKAARDLIESLVEDIHWTEDIMCVPTVQDIKNGKRFIVSFCLDGIAFAFMYKYSKYGECNRRDMQTLGEFAAKAIDNELKRQQDLVEAFYSGRPDFPGDSEPELLEDILGPEPNRFLLVLFEEKATGEDFIVREFTYNEYKNLVARAKNPPETTSTFLSIFTPNGEIEDPMDLMGEPQGDWSYQVKIMNSHSMPGTHERFKRFKHAYDEYRANNCNVL